MVPSVRGAVIFFNGATGSLGQYFGDALARAGVRGAPLRARLEDRAGLRAELACHAPAVDRGANVWLVQMAAKVSVPACESDPSGARTTNVTDTVATALDFVRWARERGGSPAVLYVSSGHVYASQPQGSWIRESDPVEPRSVYARTKLAAERELTALAQAERFPLAIARVFGLIAPRQPPNYMLQGLIRRVRERDLGAIPGLSFFRDMLDARDVCEHLVRLCATGLGGADGDALVLNVCSGQPVQLREIAARVLAAVYPAEALELGSKIVEAPGRADDIPWIVGSAKLLESRTGAPARRIGLAETIRDAVAGGR